MSERTVARRYAAALFDVVHATGEAVRAGEELAALANTIDDHAELRQVFETPTVPIAVKTAIMEALLDAAGGVSPEVTRLLVMLAERNRVGVLRDVQAAYAQRLLAAQRVVPAEVVTATPLSDASRSALSRALGAATGGDIRLTERVDPAIVGGVIARVGSLVFDASVTRHLERLREQLITNN